MAEILGSHEERLARIEAMLEALNQRFDDAILTQLKDHAKRIRELETQLEDARRVCAMERGRHQGGKAMLALILSIAGSIGGAIGALVIKLI